MDELKQLLSAELQSIVNLYSRFLDRLDKDERKNYDDFVRCLEILSKKEDLKVPEAIVK